MCSWGRRPVPQLYAWPAWRLEGLTHKGPPPDALADAALWICSAIGSFSRLRSAILRRTASYGETSLIISGFLSSCCHCTVTCVSMQICPFSGLTSRTATNRSSSCRGVVFLQAAGCGSPVTHAIVPLYRCAQVIRSFAPLCSRRMRAFLDNGTQPVGTHTVVPVGPADHEFHVLFACDSLTARIAAHCVIELAVRVIDWRVTVASPFEAHSLPSTQLPELMHGQPRKQMVTDASTQVERKSLLARRGLENSCSMIVRACVRATGGSVFSPAHAQDDSAHHIHSINVEYSLVLRTEHEYVCCALALQG